MEDAKEALDTVHGSDVQSLRGGGGKGFQA
jgi:hypothetical protein